MHQEIEVVRRPVDGVLIPDGWVRAIVPPVPGGFRRSSWRRVVTAVEAGSSGSQAVTGEWLRPGSEVALPAGSLVLTADKTQTGTAFGRHGEYATEDALCCALLLTREGDWEQVWGPRHFRQVKSAHGKTVITKLGALLAQFPAQRAEPVLLAETQWPNRRYVHACDLCQRPIAARRGHVRSRGTEASVEHWPACPSPDEPDPKAPPTCDNCERSGRGHVRYDSNGIRGRVCNSCSREPSYCLSFA